MSILTEPAVYKGVDWTGKQHLGYTILGRTEVRTYPSGNKHHIWRVECNAEQGTASLDRIDSSGDYAEGNVQFVHKTINKMKWDLTDMEFRNFCVLVAKNL